MNLKRKSSPSLSRDLYNARRSSARGKTAVQTDATQAARGLFFAPCENFFRKHLTAHLVYSKVHPCRTQRGTGPSDRAEPASSLKTECSGTAAYSYGQGEQSNRTGPHPKERGLGRAAARRENKRTAGAGTSREMPATPRAQPGAQIKASAIGRFDLLKGGFMTELHPAFTAALAPFAPAGAGAG